MNAEQQSAPFVSVSGLTKAFGGRAVVQEVAFTLAAGEFISLIGPSGSGKTTVLRMIAGLQRPDGGVITIDGKTIFDGRVDVPVEDRQLGMVFQDFALWPHMTVAQNIGFSLRLRHMPRAAIHHRVDEMLALVDLPGIGRRFPYQLSGGQQQRVALARALATGPRLLLLDEPLSSLDTGLRESMREEVLQIVRRANMSVINVTHDQDEAMAISDRIVLLRQGQVTQIGSPANLYRRPRNIFAGRFMGPANILTGQVERLDGSQAWVRWEGVTLGGSSNWPEAKVGADAAILFRPEAVRIAADVATNAGDALLRGTVLRETFSGGRWRVRVQLHQAENNGTGPMTILAALDRDLGVGNEVALLVDAAQSVVVAPDKEAQELDMVEAAPEAEVMVRMG